ncbi:MAG: 1-deoxy-D-xylulose-5-phosphate reductoisomerase [Ignavibacteria bacterium]|nr:1-deoxy-D-xylulose-5-phosphate reductoisomerase [Ignavibacteria bacterium]MBK7185961.1 1-deoxy-D-xylulose-5-phosphate reductoisomerase [Ignavibacteria bacterium]MBK7412078.1 1-deoxy-D-xylulose-5-phosphate reductoisomerase [Ignavibacteria bacterium]MBK7575941.1 1-deoxy-D-xylulose-5-phosphate reductoisomerase [Ignavibacteria bacterium]MBK9182609.1 1-deoxy-D-xylulose-5-phosphate reductoisomerase [Ignavibacteria bacterium]
MPTAARRNVTILGSTGSIGTQGLDIVSRDPERFALRWITCNTKWQDLVEQVRRYQPYGVAIREESAWQSFRNALPDFTGPVLCGDEGICDAAADAENDVVLSAMVGFSGVLPTMAAIRAGHVIGLANKESLVSAGAVLVPAAAEHSATLIAVDSEHSAILQCLAGERASDVARLVITASGGPFRSLSLKEMASVTPAMALKHPNWTMGAKITIDSATLMNKGFEVIEARWLFDLPGEKIEVVIHPQSIVHSMVEFVDGSVKAQMGLPTMLLPIQYALTYPYRMPLDIPRMDLATIGSLTFEAPDLNRFPCLRIAYDALTAGGSAGAVINAANEVAVASFLVGELSYLGIAKTIEWTLNYIEHVGHPSLDDVVAIDAEARRRASEYIIGTQWKS